MSIRIRIAVASLASLAAAVPVSAQVVLNEVMPAPGTDWNQTGSYSSQDDEWIELLCLGPSGVDEWIVGDGSGGAATPRFAVGDTLQTDEILFVTGELASDWESANGFPSVGLSLNNSSDAVYLFQVAGGATTLVDSLVWSGSTADVSVGRLPDGVGSWTDFDALSPGGSGAQPTPGGPNGGPATPKILSTSVSPAFPSSADTVTVQTTAGDTDGIASCSLELIVDGGAPQAIAMAPASGVPTLGTWEAALGPFPGGSELSLVVTVNDGSLIAATNPILVTVTAAGSAVAINEMLADPPAGLDGDANGDGVRDTADDEFVEIMNRSAGPVDLTGWEIRDATSQRHVFASGPVLQAGEMFVVFGGGSPTGIPAGADVASSGGLSLNNTADSVQLVDGGGVIQDAHTYGSEANADQSLIRVPDGTGAWTRPGDQGFGWAFSPGAANVGTTSITSTSWSRVKALYRD
ncbi:MAG TPA: lamin tail domain-containing protein [bacterium]|nr:lamin tail domain-containing protein [bacterium]